MRKMKRFSESRLGLGHIVEVLRAAEKAGVQAIVNDADGLFFLYDPEKKEWVILDNAYLSRIDATIFDVIEDRSTFGQVWWDCRATEFKDFKVEWDKLFSAAAQGDEDVFASNNCEPIRETINERRMPMKGGMRQTLADWYVNAFPSDAELGSEMAAVGSTFQDLWRALERGEDVYDVMGAGDSIIRERLFDRLAELKRTDYDTIYEMWIGTANESIDDPRDWSANEEEIEIQWLIDDKDFGIESGSTEFFVVDLDLVDSFDDLVYQVSKEIEKEYGGMRFDYDDEWVFLYQDKWLKKFGYR